MKFKFFDIVKMYGCGAENNTFWTGDLGYVVARSAMSDCYICRPIEFPEEKHTMHEKQLRKVKSSETKTDRS